MPKSRAEIQKAYRERKKATEGQNYLKKETIRVKGYYKPTSEIPTHKLNERREKIKECMRKKRRLLKQTDASQNQQQSESNERQQVVDEIDSTPGPCDSTSSGDIMNPVASTSSEREQLKVKMNFKKKSSSRGKEVAKTKKKLRQLNKKVKTLTKRNETLRKRMYRGTEQKSEIQSIHVPENTENRNTPEKNAVGSSTCKKRKSSEEKEKSNLTPRSLSKAQLRSEGVSPSKHPKLVKTLSFHNSIVEDINKSIEPKRGRAEQREVLSAVCGKSVKRSRCKSRAAKLFEINYHQIELGKKGIKKMRNTLERKQISQTVIKFLEREDNSACMPGKRDAKKSGNSKIQTRVLSDYMYNLHLKFKAEYPRIKISLTTFTSYRPSYIKLVHFSSRRTCLCQKHQNMALKVKALKIIGAVNTNNPDSLTTQNTDAEIIQCINECNTETIKYSEWKRKEVEHKGRISKRMQIETVEKSKTEFVKMFEQDLINFRRHTERVKCQYEQIKLLKESLPENHVMCQMDFAENYSCSHADEVQSAYFDKGSVTLHPVVTYYKDSDNILQHTSRVYISDTAAHTSGTVYAFMKVITDHIKRDHPETKCIHYVTDSPTSQYRNQYTMYITAYHEKYFGIKASWQYFEAGHGKGPCDGVGGTTKRLADSAVKRQTVIIQNAEDFYNWGKCQESQIKYDFVPQSKCDDARNELQGMKTKQIKGTIDIHSVVTLGLGEIAVRNTSCFCKNCFDDGEFHPSCDGWRVFNLPPTPEVAGEPDPVEDAPLQQGTQAVNEPGPIAAAEDADNEVTPASVSETNSYSVGSYVAAEYNKKWFIGKVLEFDPDDKEYNISFMEASSSKVGNIFKWPRQEDIIWVPNASVLCGISDPVPHGKRKMFKIPEVDVKRVLELFEK